MSYQARNTLWKGATLKPGAGRRNRLMRFLALRVEQNVTAFTLTGNTALLCLQLAYGEAQVLDKIMYEEEVRREVFAFEQQFHYAVR